MNTLLFVTSALFGTWAYVKYYLDTRKKSITPNRWSWLIWIVTTTVEALTFDEVSGDIVKATIFYISAACCVVVTIRIWSQSVWEKPNWVDIVCVLLSFFAILLWLEFRLTLWAHFIAIIAIPISFYPTWKDIWMDHKKECSVAWKLWTVGDFFALVLIMFRLDKGEELPYIITEFTCHGATWLVVAIRQRATH